MRLSHLESNNVYCMNVEELYTKRNVLFDQMGFLFVCFLEKHSRVIKNTVLLYSVL